MSCYTYNGELQFLHYKGSFLKPCPGTKYYLCCGYYFLNLIQNCPLDCYYCVLQEYFANNPGIKVFVNLKEMKKEVEKKIKKNKFYRIGTGELTDSLALEGRVNFLPKIIPFFRKKENVILELKTKVSYLTPLLKLTPSKNIVISFSLAPPFIITNYEKHTSPLSSRLLGASICAKYGYGVGFHFDPIIRYQNWEKDYQTVVKMVFKHVPPEKIIWISLGGLRFHLRLKKIIEKRGVKFPMIYDEFVRGKDNKFRYFKPIRVELYKKILSYIHHHSTDVFVYLCMESDSVWREVFGYVPYNLSEEMDKRAQKFIS